MDRLCALINLAAVYEQHARIQIIALAPVRPHSWISTAGIDQLDVAERGAKPHQPDIVMTKNAIAIIDYQGCVIVIEAAITLEHKRCHQKIIIDCLSSRERE